MSRSFISKYGVKIAISTVLTVFIIGVLKRQGMAFVPPREAIMGVPHLWVYPAYVLLYALTTYVRAARWRLQLRAWADVSFRRIIMVSWVSFAAIVFLPMRMGEVVRPMMIRDRGRVSATAAAGTVVAERVIDGLFLSIVLAIALIVAPGVPNPPEYVVGLSGFPTARVREFGSTMLAIFVIAFAVIGAYYKFRKLARELTLRVFGIVSMKLAEKLAGIAEKLADGIRFLATPKDAVPYLIETAIYWALNALGMWFLAWGCGLTHPDGSMVTYMDALALMGMLGAAMLIPAPPGMLGVFQAGLYCAMTLYFSPEVILGPGAVYVFMLYVLQVGWTAVAALLGLLDPGTRRALLSADTTDIGLSISPPAEVR